MDKKTKNRPHKTYPEGNAWITPLGKYNIVHYDYPTDAEIKQRFKDAVKEIVNEEGFEDDCPLCQLMKKEPYNIVYYCQKWCHECNKTDKCMNFNPNSRKEQKELESDIKNY